MNNTEIMDENNSCEEITMRVHCSRLYTFPKRICDIFFGLIGCIFLIPLYIGVKIAYLLSKDYAPIMFRQERIGQNGKPIYIYKFRSMVPNADEVLYKMLEENEAIRREYKRYKKLKNDPRITRVGNFLRATSIDEFPQFLNVLKGDMSLVGPRPYLFREKEDMGEYFDIIIKCKPGITGYWQVNGRSETDFGYRLVLDEYYYIHKSLIMDIKIVIKTIKQVIFKKGI